MPWTANDGYEQLREYADNRGQSLEVDEESGVIKGVKILGTVSRNKAQYPPEVIARAVKRYEGAPSYVGHCKEGENPSYATKLGVHRNVRAMPDGLYADFHFSPKHPLAAQLVWDSKHDPEHVGFSHIADCKVERKKGGLVVTDIGRVHSVDLVTSPATTKGLYEEEQVVLDSDPELREFAESCLSAMDSARAILFTANLPLDEKRTRLAEAISAWQGELNGTNSSAKENRMEMKDITLEQLREQRADLVAQLTGTDEVSKLKADLARLAEEVKTANAAVAAKESELSTIRLREAEQKKLADIDAELKAAKLDPAKVSEVFMEQLKAAPDQAGRTRLVEALKPLLASKPSTPIQTGAPFAQVTDTQPVTHDSLSGLFGK